MKRRDAIKTSALALGYAISPKALTDLFLRCHSEVSLDWKPVFFSPADANTLAEITETILPKTATPGAKELGVPAFIDKMVRDLLSVEEQKDFMAGLKKLEAECMAVNGKPFVDCSTEQRETFLLKQDMESAKFGPSTWGISLGKPAPVAFYRRVKSLTLVGYYTSQKVGKEILKYDPIPGAFIACMPLPEVGNAWNE
jgi:hypothetical protein